MVYIYTELAHARELVYTPRMFSLASLRGIHYAAPAAFALAAVHAKIPEPSCVCVGYSFVFPPAAVAAVRTCLALRPFQPRARSFLCTCAHRG